MCYDPIPKQACLKISCSLIFMVDISPQVTFEGGSGYISFDENGDRPGFSGNNAKFYM